MYSLMVQVKNIVTGTSSETRLTVARKAQPMDEVNEYSPIKYSGYDDIHYRRKRALVCCLLFINIHVFTLSD